MKKLFYFFALLLCFVACSDKEEPMKPQFEAPNYEIHIQLVNEESGETLLDPMAFYLPDEGVVVTRGNGEVYPLSFFNEPHYNPNAPFRLEQYIENGSWRYRVVVDGFTIDQSFHEKLTIYWGELLDFYTEIEVGAEVDFSTPEPTITRTLTVDGVPVSCEEGQDWYVLLSRTISEFDPEPIETSLLAAGNWWMTDWKVTLDGAPVTTCASEQTLFGVHQTRNPEDREMFDDRVKMITNVVLDGVNYSVEIPQIYISRDADKEAEVDGLYFEFGEMVAEARLSIDEEPQTITNATVEGWMYQNRSNSTALTPKPMLTLAPQTDCHSDICICIEWENGTLELQINYLRIMDGYDLPS